MTKQSFVTMKRANKIYKVYVSEILRVHSLTRKNKVPVPRYFEPSSPISSEKETNIDFGVFKLE